MFKDYLSLVENKSDDNLLTLLEIKGNIGLTPPPESKVNNISPTINVSPPLLMLPVGEKHPWHIHTLPCQPNSVQPQFV